MVASQIAEGQVLECSLHNPTREPADTEDWGGRMWAGLHARPQSRNGWALFRERDPISRENKRLLLEKKKDNKGETTGQFEITTNHSVCDSIRSSLQFHFLRPSPGGSRDSVGQAGPRAANC